MSSPRFYWDANAFLSFFQETPGQFALCRQVLEAGERGEATIVTSALTLTEVVHLKGRVKMTSKDEGLIEGMFEKPYIVLIDVDRRTAENARRLLWRFTALKPKDAVHVASALITKVDALHTFDEALLKLNGRIESLKISRPVLRQAELPL